MSAPHPEARQEEPEARPIAAEERSGTAAPGGTPVVIFTLDGQEFALGLGRLVEIVPYRPPTPVPGTGDSVEGIVPWRGRMVTVLRTRRRLGLTEPAGASGRQMMILEEEGEWLGLVVDAVSRVTSLRPEDRRPIPPALGLTRPRLFLGAYARPGGCLLLVDDARILGAPEEIAARDGGGP